MLTEDITEKLTEIALNNNTSTGDFIFTIVLYFLVFGLVIGGFIYFRKYMLNRVVGIKSGSSMKVRDRLIIAQDKQIILLEIGGRVLMIGVSAQSMSALGEFKSEELYDDSDSEEPGENKKDGFLNILGDKIKTGFDNFEKNKKD